MKPTYTLLLVVTVEDEDRFREQLDLTATEPLLPNIQREISASLDEVGVSVDYTRSDPKDPNVP